MFVSRLMVIIWHVPLEINSILIKGYRLFSFIIKPLFGGFFVIYFTI